MSPAFQTFFKETPKHSEAWGKAIHALGEANVMDSKTTALAYLAVLAALRLESGIPFHVAEARKAGATREEVASAILLGLPAAGNGVIAALPIALQAYDSGGVPN
jgi:alkylhydroperoxidase/carboxymuconolactone decarboxylase family protein YurZ